MSTTSTHLMLEQYAALPDSPCKQELLNGEVYESDSDFRCHYFSQEVARALIKILPGTEFEVYFPLSINFPNTEHATVLRPNVSVFRTQELPKLHEIEEPYIALHPLLICEGLYPGQDKEFLRKKIDVYKSWGVPWIWSLDVHHRGVLVEGPTGKQWQEHEINLRKSIAAASVGLGTVVQQGRSMSPGPSLRHDQLAQTLLRALDPLGTQGFYIGIETSFYLNSQGKRKEVKPDVIVISLTEWQQALDVQDKQDAQLCPLLPIEVRSPGNRPREILQKVHLYMENGAIQVWLLEPKDGGVWVFSRQAHPFLGQRPHQHAISAAAVLLEY